MARKKKPDFGGPVHLGRKSWWDGRVKTLCGVTYPPEEADDRFTSTKPTCAACIAEDKRRWW